jgi:hypothetical protein
MSASSRKERIELGIELTPSGSADAVVRLVAVVVWAGIEQHGRGQGAIPGELAEVPHGLPNAPAVKREAVCDGGHEKND